YERENCTLQIGGSDQWGNITAGMDFIRRSREEMDEDIKVFGLTVPLLTKADGSKFGKTAGGAIWLDPEKTTPYEFYQFWLNTDDQDVMKFLQYFTFVPEEDMQLLEKSLLNEPEKRLAHKRLAEEMTSSVHGQAALEKAKKISASLFSGDLKSLTKHEIEEGFKDVPTHNVSFGEKGLVDLLVEANISSSKRQAREDISNGAIYINGDREKDIQYVVDGKDRHDGTFTNIRRGKKKYCLIRYQ